MDGIISKVRTMLDYASTGVRLGGDLGSKWLLATMLTRYKLRCALGFKSSRLYTATIRFGQLKTLLHFGEADIFIVHEMFGGSSGYVVEALNYDPPRCILDLGAHIGLAALRFRASFPEATIHCYEPDPYNFRLLALNTRNLEGVVVHQAAVGAFSGDGMFYVRPHRHTASSLERPKHDEPVVEVQCIIRSLDEVLYGIGAVDLIKFDIEGAEYEVFSHSRRVHGVKHIFGEMRAELGQLRRFCTLFSNHSAQWRSITPNMHLVYFGPRKRYSIISETF